MISVLGAKLKFQKRVQTSHEENFVPKLSIFLVNFPSLNFKIKLSQIIAFQSKKEARNLIAP